ncbi:MAG TPA: NUDIX domain-containing protein [Reyranella sp.]|nr:NUDIX domain-containing protein [Reyranella sp.]
MSQRKDSAGLVIYRRPNGDGPPDFFLVHPGGPYWVRKDQGAWSIPKGEIEDGEDKLDAARREVREETGFDLHGPFQRLPPVRQPSRKVVHAWAIEAPHLDPAKIESGTFEMEWPPHSGRKAAFPEVDRAAWFDVGEAMLKILPGQRPILEKLLERLGVVEKAT